MDIKYEKIKSIIDFLLALILLPFVIVIVAFFSILIIVDSPGSPIYKQERIGLNGKKFTIYKLRTMRLDAEENGAKWAEKEDSRITRLGSFLRKTRIDELPQLVNILKGDMSIIGPRPEREIFINEFLKEIPNFNDRLKVKPGITGWAQVNGGYEISPVEKLRYDKEYIENQSFKMDLEIGVKTIKVILTGDGAR